MEPTALVETIGMFFDYESQFVRDSEGNILFLAYKPPLKRVTSVDVFTGRKHKKGGDAVPLKNSSKST